MTFQKGIDLLVVLASCISLYLGLGLGLPIWYFAAALLLTARTIWLLLDDSQPAVSDYLSAFTLVIAFFLAPPGLSDDFQRYLWEGFAANKGYSPYLHSPQSLYPILDHPSEGLVNHSHRHHLPAPGPVLFSNRGMGQLFGLQLESFYSFELIASVVCFGPSSVPHSHQLSRHSFRGYLEYASGCSGCYAPLFHGTGSLQEETGLDGRSSCRIDRLKNHAPTLQSLLFLLFSGEGAAETGGCLCSCHLTCVSALSQPMGRFVRVFFKVFQRMVFQQSLLPWPGSHLR